MLIERPRLDKIKALSLQVQHSVYHLRFSTSEPFHPTLAWNLELLEQVMYCVVSLMVVAVPPHKGIVTLPVSGWRRTTVNVQVSSRSPLVAVVLTYSRRSNPPPREAWVSRRQRESSLQMASRVVFVHRLSKGVIAFLCLTSLRRIFSHLCERSMHFESVIIF